MEYQKFKKRYAFNEDQIKLPITEEKHREILKDLNAEQTKIFEDKKSRAILVLAGPGSGKTKVLVHKIASLITVENHKPEYFLMLAHSRAAVSEFKERLQRLIGNQAYHVDIYTFHAYAAMLQGQKMDDETKLADIIVSTTQMLRNNEIQMPLKTMLVLDEYQDVGQNTYAFIRAIFERMGKEKKIIAVGDDDQCINNFGNDPSDSELMRQYEADFNIVEEEEEEEKGIPSAKYSLLANYRSSPNIVEFANAYIQPLPKRLKSEPLHAVQKETGFISITKSLHPTSLLVHIAHQIDKQTTRCAVLLRSNDEVLTLYSLLVAQGINAKYITGKEGFRVGNLIELQDFLQAWQETKDFEQSKAILDQKYAQSKNLPLVQSVIRRFEEENGDGIVEAHNHFTALFAEYLQLITFEEFERTKADVIVSTMHKAKGKEFETVFLAVNDNFIQTDYDARLLYVAMTRAKKSLHIFTKDALFDRYQHFSDSYTIAKERFAEADKIVLMMGLGDITLGSQAAQRGIHRTHPIAGESVQIEKQFNEDKSVWYRISKNNQTIAVLSKSDKTKERISNTIFQKEQQGYRLLPTCEIEFIVNWKSPEKELFQEVLCKIEMQKN